MKNRPGEKIKLTSIDELLGVVNEESAMEIEINKIHAFKNHPFKVLDDEKMQDLIESVRVLILLRIHRINMKGGYMKEKIRAPCYLAGVKKGLNKRERSRAKRLQTIRKSVCSYI